MKPCARCDRHVRLVESVCPFCGANLVEGTAPSVFGWAVGLAVLGAACSPGKNDTSTEGATTEASSEATTSSGEATLTAAPTTGTDGTMGGTGTSTSTSSGSDSDSDSESSTTECVSCSGSSEGGAFIYAAPDMGLSIGCDPWVQDCPAGQKCAPTSDERGEPWDSLDCVPQVLSPVQIGEPCTVVVHPTSGIDSCDKGLVCFMVDPQALEGVCVAQCGGTPDAPECAAGTSCVEVVPDIASLCQ